MLTFCLTLIDCTPLLCWHLLSEVSPSHTKAARHTHIMQKTCRWHFTKRSFSKKSPFRSEARVSADRKVKWETSTKEGFWNHFVILSGARSIVHCPVDSARSFLSESLVHISDWNVLNERWVGSVTPHTASPPPSYFTSIDYWVIERTARPSVHSRWTGNPCSLLEIYVY